MPLEVAHVSAETSGPLACDTGRVVMRDTADGRVVEVGAGKEAWGYARSTSTKTHPVSECTSSSRLRPG